MKKIIEILKSRISSSEVINSWLFNNVQDIITKSTNHLKYVTRTMPEFDLHDSTHSEAVLGIVEKLLGGNVSKLSSFELFFIIASAYLHDCGMAISDYEKKVLELTEGTQEKFINDKSLKNDGKKCFSYSEAKDFIIKNKVSIYKNFDDEIKNLLFAPNLEDEFIDYLSNMLIDYQEFRNGHYAIIKESADFRNTNQTIRIEYIRRTHHKRIFDYIGNWGKTKFSSFPIKGMGQKIANDLAEICKSHCEKPVSLESLKTSVSYYGSETSNLQFVAMLLRIGDIVHFSYDRAPIELRSLHQFDSDYSFQQWKIKSNGVSYDITNGTIAYKAFVTEPADYYKLQKYVNWVDQELELFLKLATTWDKRYQIKLNKKVDRANITYDDSVFTPVPGLKFTLNQSKILKLLMGVGLYKEKFACLRELYQNSLDACRCQIAKDESKKKVSKGVIEFGLGNEKGEKYLYCIDNGKGMSKSIIESYLLKIGNSYYQSPEFYQEQAKTGFKFTPTSQFGIGILSCFMIGQKLEITTKEENGNIVSCIIDGPHEYFYYKNPSKVDKDLIPFSGTIVKVFLKKGVIDKVNTSEIKNLGFVSYDHNGYIQELRPDLRADYKNWENSLYRLINNFAEIIPNQIELYVKWNNNNRQRVFSKPIIYSSDTLKIEDLDVLDAKINMFREVCKYKLKDYINLIDTSILEARYNGVQYLTIMKLPKPGLERYGLDVMKHLPILYSSGVCVDGISVSRANFGIYSFTEILSRHGLINFYGDNRPQLSIDRTDIIGEKEDKYDNISKEIVRKVIDNAIKLTNEHLKKYEINRGCALYNMVWESIFQNFNYSSNILIETLSKSRFNNIEWSNLSSFLDSNLTIGEFITKDQIKILNYDFRQFNNVSQIILLNKLYSASEIVVRADYVSVICEKLHNDKVLDYDMEDELNRTKYLARTSNYGHIFDEYDIISKLYPIVPDYFYDLILVQQEKHVLNDHLKKISNFSNGIAAFYEQNPFEVDEDLGLYMEERNTFGMKEMHIRTLNKKRSSINIFEAKIPINEDVDYKKYRLVLTAYIAPKRLSIEENKDVEKYKKSNPSYYKGVTEGWSLIVTGEPDEKMNTFIKAGKCTRKKLVQLLPQSFWEKYSNHIHIFPNGKLLKEYINPPQKGTKKKNK